MKLIKLIFYFSLTLIFLHPLPTHAATPTAPTAETTANPECTISSDCEGKEICLHGRCVGSTGTSTSDKPTCITKDGEEGINTALGCISTNVESGGFINSILQLAIGLGGIIALLLILGGVFIITTSAGNPDKLNQGKELITSAVSGLLFIILSIVLLNLIGIKILAIPGF